MVTINPNKEKYFVPVCDVLEVAPEGVIAASGGLSDDKYEFEKL